MKKRLIFYLLQIIAMDFSKVNLFIFQKKANFILIFSLTFFLTSLLGIGTYKIYFLNKEFNILVDIFGILGKILIIILIVSFSEYFLFFSTKIGRVIYVGLYFFLSVFFVVESLITNFIVSNKKLKILWASIIPPDEVESKYNLNLFNNELSHNTNSNTYDFAIYDYPPKGDVNIKNLLSTIISSKNPIDLVTFIEETVERIPLKYVNELWLLKNIRTYENVYDKLRRFVNFITSLILLITLFPLTFIIALLHKISSKGPIFFIQERLGYKGRMFNLIKFRTMVNDAEKDGPMFAHNNDPRITKIGKIMRLFRIDEVPQLINILKGEMSLIGPRPERKEFIIMLQKEIPFYKLRHEVRPGLTGWAQVNHSYAGSNLDDHLKKLEYDMYYIKNRSLPLDILILLKTIKTVLWIRGT